MSPALRNRLNLLLRSERAMGLKSLPVKVSAAAVSDAPAAVNSPAPQPVAPARPPVAPGRPPVSPARPVAAARPPVASPAPARTAPRQQPVIEIDTPFDSPVLSTVEKRKSLDEMMNQVSACTRCILHAGRIQTVFGEGDPDAELMFIGEGPGQTEDETGRPFVGRAGELLTKMIKAMGLSREQVFIANIVKCRPPGNRAPAPDETAACTPFLLRQIEIIRPKVIVTLGLPASQFILQTRTSMSRMRGNWHQWRGIRVMPTFHPAYILRSYTPENRKAAWSDLQQVMAELGLPAPRGGV